MSASGAGRKTVPVLAGAKIQSSGVGDLLWPVFLTRTNPPPHAHTCSKALVDSWLQEEDFKWRSRKTLEPEDPGDMVLTNTYVLYS